MLDNASEIWSPFQSNLIHVVQAYIRGLKSMQWVAQWLLHVGHAQIGTHEFVLNFRQSLCI